MQPHVVKFIAVYEPIRHKYFAHRGKDSKEAIEELFKKAVITELAGSLRFAYGLIMGIQDMAWNGTLPVQWSTDKAYDGLFKVYEKSTERLVQNLKNRA